MSPSSGTTVLLNESRIHLGLLQPAARVKPGQLRASSVQSLRAQLLLANTVLHRLRDLIEALFPHWDRLAFTMQHQQTTMWCWSALTVSVSKYYHPSSTWTQCSLVNNQLGKTTCCNSPTPGDCVQGWWPELSLPATGNLASHKLSAATFAEVDSEIDHGRPIGVRVDWSGGGAHALAVFGYLEGTTNYVAIADPWYGSSDMAYDTFKTSYQGSGTWTQTYFTQA
jgi:hypothetical protein